MICEAWTNTEITNAELSIEGYNLEVELRRDREDTLNGIGGGLIIYTKKGLVIRKNSKFDSIKFNQFCALTIMAKDPLHILLVYRPPNSGTQNTNELCSILDRAGENTIIIGDFNAPDIDWDHGQAGPRGRKIFTAAVEANMDQLVNFSTHRGGNKLDLVLTNCPQRILSVSEEGKLGNSDHSTILVTAEIAPARGGESERRRNWKKGDYEAIRKRLREIEWEETLGSGSTEENWNKFKNIVENCVNDHVPYYKAFNNSRPRWMSKEITSLIRRKRAAWKSYKLYPSAENAEKYNSLEKEVKNKVRKSKRKMERELTREDDSRGKNFTRYIKSKMKTRTGIGPLKNNEGQLVSDNKEMACILNNFFSSVFTKEDKENLPQKEKETNVEIGEVTVTREKIMKKIDKLRKDSAPGPDGIHPMLLKETKYEISKPLCIIFEQSLQSGEVPADWRVAAVTAIYKKGTKSEPGNYRPVSLTSVACKLIEGIIKDKLMDHLLENKLINDSQHGFLPGRSCATNVVQFMDVVTKIIDKGNPADIFYLDFAKAFDKVPHERLLLKLAAKGVAGRILKWIRNWLTGRTQWVVLNGAKSESSNVDSGMPQGTILGPPLFTVHIDDIDLVAMLAEILIKFADDTKGAKEITCEGDRRILQEILDNLQKWASTWGMEFNTSKCKIMHVGRGNPGYTYYLNGTELSTTEEEIDVGITVQKSLKPGRHCEKAANRATAILKLILRNFHYRDRNVFMKLYKQYVRPHLEYSSPAWSPSSRADIEKLEAVQRKALSQVAGLQGKSYEQRCEELKLESLEERRKKQDMKLVHSMLLGKGNIRCETLFEKASNRQGARTRNTDGVNNLKQPMARTELRKNSFAVRTINQWNGLPEDLKSCTTTEQFKRQIKNLQ
jgi:hypothetical protein